MIEDVEDGPSMVIGFMDAVCTFADADNFKYTTMTNSGGVLRTSRITFI